MNATITIIDSVRCKVEPKDAATMLKEHLCYDKPYWKNGRFAKQKIENKKLLISRGGVFYFGLYDRAVSYLESKGVTVSTVQDRNYRKLNSIKTVDPAVKGITFREDQKVFISKALLSKRGVISSPTGSGKTVIIAALVSCFPESKIAIISHTTTLAEQTSEDLKGFGFTDVDSVYAGYKKELPRILVTTNQSFINQKENYYKYDVAIIDECHIGFSNEYTNNCKILTNMIAPYKFAVTATLPPDKGSAMILEGIVGPTLGHLSLQEAMEKGIVAEGYVQLVKVPRFIGLEKEKSYKRIYDQAIVHNRARNRMICQIAKEAVDGGMSVLILVGNSIEHGTNIQVMLREVFGMNVSFIYGKTTAVERLAESRYLNDKKTNCVIANKVWREGANIPSLDVLINAAAERGDVATLQRIGRALRRTKDKTMAFIVDFLDTGRYLSDHAIDRIGTYIDNGLKFL